MRRAAEAESFGFPLPGPDERRRLLEETAWRCKALFAGRALDGRRSRPGDDGPLRRPLDARGPRCGWGHANAVVDLAGRIADGWNGWGLSPERFAAKASRLRAAAAAANRDGRRLGGPDATRARPSELARMLAERRDRGPRHRRHWSGDRRGARRLPGGLGRGRRYLGRAHARRPRGPPRLLGREVVPAVRSGR